MTELQGESAAWSVTNEMSWWSCSCCSAVSVQCWEKQTGCWSQNTHKTDTFPCSQLQCSWNHTRTHAEMQTHKFLIVQSSIFMLLTQRSWKVCVCVCASSHASFLTCPVGELFSPVRQRQWLQAIIACCISSVVLLFTPCCRPLALGFNAAPSKLGFYLVCSRKSSTSLLFLRNYPTKQ